MTIRSDQYRLVVNPNGEIVQIDDDIALYDTLCKYLVLPYGLKQHMVTLSSKCDKFRYERRDLALNRHVHFILIPS